MAVISNEVIVVSSLVKTLTEPVGGWITSAIISVEDASIRITLDGTDPNNGTKNGLVIPAGVLFEVIGTRDMANFKAIKSGGTDASISVNYQQKD